MGSRNVRSILAIGAATLALGLFATPATAVPGDKIADIFVADSQGGVSVAFDGSFLYYTSFFGTTLHRIATDGVSGHVDVPITDSTSGDPVPTDAISFDAGRGLLWGASATDIYLIDRTTGSATFQFSVFGMLVGDCDNGFGCPTLVDGIAFDGIDDGVDGDPGTVWYSPDASQRIYQFDTDGALLSFFDVNDPPNDTAPECGFNYSSGVAVGGPLVYNAADGCDFYFQYDRAGTKLAAFPYDGQRAEDLECDDVTFAVDVMWVRDASDGHFRAFEVPEGTCAVGGGDGGPDERRMTGGGSVFTALGMRVTHGFELHCDPAAEPNNLQVNWGKGNSFHLESTTSASCSDDPGIEEAPPVAGFDTYEGEGTGRCSGLAATIEWTFTDAGEPGGSDTADITITGACALTVSGTLAQGNHQAHAS